jgi:hypothetical protein
MRLLSAFATMTNASEKKFSCFGVAAEGAGAVGGTPGG